MAQGKGKNTAVRREKSVQKAAFILNELKKLKEIRAQNPDPERDADLFFLDRKIREYREDLDRVKSH